MMPELFMAAAVGASGKPLLRVHTAGSVGGSTAVVAASLVQAGVHRRVLAGGVGKQAQAQPLWAPSLPGPVHNPGNTRAGGHLAPPARAHIPPSGAPRRA